MAALIRHHGIYPEASWSDAACRRFLRKLREDGLPLERWASFRGADLAGKGIGEDPRDMQGVALRAVVAISACQRGSSSTWRTPSDAQKHCGTFM